MENIVLISQGGGRYLFSVPDNVTLKEGEKVKCDTRRGITDGTVAADSICVEPEIARWIGKLIGATFPLKSVVGRMEYKEFEASSDSASSLKLYCIKDDPGWLTKGRIYEFVNGDIQPDMGYHEPLEYENYKNFKQSNPGLSSCLVPLVKRPAKTGECIIAMEEPPVYDGRYDRYDLLSVTEDYSNIISQWSGKAVGFKNITHPDRPWQYKVIRHDSYLVLDGYRPEPEYWTGKVICVKTDLTTLTEGKCYPVVNGTITFDNGGEWSFDVLSAKEFVDIFRGNTKFIEYKGE